MDADDPAIENKHLLEKNSQSSTSTQTSMNMDMLLTKNDEQDLAEGVEVTHVQACTVEELGDHESTKLLYKVRERDEIADENSTRSEEECTSKTSEAFSINDRVQSYNVAVEIDLKGTSEDMPTSNAHTSAEPISTRSFAEVTEEIVRKSQNVVDVWTDGQERPKETIQECAQEKPTSPLKTEIRTISFSLRDEVAESMDTVEHLEEESNFCVCSVEARSSKQSCSFQPEDTMEQ
ncbi:hypothetical protein OSTOST_22265, partial [Ostertagia ostertagi]